MKEDTTINQGARERILEVAGEVFAEHGLRYATVREICSKASVNVAAINYYFGGKENLYISVLKYCRDAAFQKYPLDLRMDEKKSPEDHLKMFIESFLLRVLEKGQPTWFFKLVAKEYIEPTSALDMLVEETIRPTFQFLSSVVRRIINKPVSEEIVRHCCLSVVSQCLFFLYAKPIIKRLFYQDAFSTEKIRAMADHIAQFSVVAIKSFAGDGRREKKRKGTVWKDQTKQR